MQSTINSVTFDPAEFLWNADSWLEIALANEDASDQVRQAHGYKAAIMLNTIASVVHRYGAIATARDQRIWEKHRTDSEAILERYEERLGPQYAASLRAKPVTYSQPMPPSPDTRPANYVNRQPQPESAPRRYVKFTPAQEDEIAKGYAAATVSELAIMYDCSENSIRRVLNDKKVSMRRPGERILK